MHLKNSIKEYIREIDLKYGFKEVSTPIVGDKKLYEISGHLDHYSDTMFPVMDLHGEQLILRPMTCPHHILLYQAEPKTYNEFPIRYSEQSPLFRYEKSGALTGLERVRAMELTEGHVFVRKDQIKSEIRHCYNMIQETLKKFNIEIYSLVLSLRDPKDKTKYFDDDKM
jgi:threonyl-tRNA synthetase